MKGKRQMKKSIAVSFAIVSVATAGVLLTGCKSREKKTEVTVFAAKSLNSVMDELCEKYVDQVIDVMKSEGLVTA